MAGTCAGGSTSISHASRVDKAAAFQQNTAVHIEGGSLCCVLSIRVDATRRIVVYGGGVNLWPLKLRTAHSIASCQWLPIRLGALCYMTAGVCALTVRARRDVGAIGAEDTRKAEVGQLADVAARVLLCGLGALDQHIGALQITAQQQPSSALHQHLFDPAWPKRLCDTAQFVWHHSRSMCSCAMGP